MSVGNSRALNCQLLPESARKHVDASSKQGHNVNSVQTQHPRLRKINLLQTLLFNAQFFVHKCLQRNVLIITDITPNC